MATGAPYDRRVTSQRIRPRFGGRVRPALLAPVVVAIVLGILGMHGIDAHGMSLQGPRTDAADAAPPTAVVMAGHDPATVTRDEVHSAGRATSSASSQSGDRTDDVSGMGGMSGMVMLCVAMLAGAAVALLVVLVRRGRLPKVWAVLEPAGRVRPVVPAVLRVGAGPPAVWRFSVIRC